VSDKRLIVIESEFASVLGVSKRDGNTLSAVLRNAWDSGNLDTLVKNAPVKATNAHISIIGHITQIELKRGLSQVEGSNGFANRFLWVAAKRSQFLPEGGALLDLAPFQTRLAESIEFGTRAGRLFRDEEASVRWRELYRILGVPHPGLFGDVTARSEAQVLRLSMIYALLDKSEVIRREHLEAAYCLWQYCEDSARFIFGDSTGDALADKLLTAIREQPRSMRDLHKALSGHCSSNQLRATLRRLVEQGLIECRKESSGGRPAEIWHATT
jgi:hypothetical protein